MKDYLTSDIIAQALIQWPDISTRQVYRYLHDARKLNEELGKQNLRQKVAYYVTRKKILIREMHPDEKKTAAGVTAVNKVLDSMAALEGVTPNVVKLVGDPDNPLQINADVRSKQAIDYKKLSEDEIDQLIKLHGKAASD